MFTYNKPVVVLMLVLAVLWRGVEYFNENISWLNGIQEIAEITPLTTHEQELYRAHLLQGFLLIRYRASLLRCTGLPSHLLQGFHLTCSGLPSHCVHTVRKPSGK